MSLMDRRLVLGLLLLPAAGAAHIYSGRGLAMRGTDVVAYVTEGLPIPGLAEHFVDWQGARWLFASAANRARFLAAPAAHAPAYGGFCAWAVAQGYASSTDPAAWRIVEGRLHLNFDVAIRRRWERDLPGNIARADANWPRLREG